MSAERTTQVAPRVSPEPVTGVCVIIPLELKTPLNVIYFKNFKKLTATGFNWEVHDLWPHNVI